MLVARRDPPFDRDAQNGAPGNLSPYPAAKAPRITRLLTGVQMIGSLLAVPVGIASAYSFYLANFSPERTCQNLRSSIVAMLDKSVDATTRRALVRRDVEAFEKTCAAVDPEATAAFKTLLAAEKVVALPTAAPIPVAKTQHTEPGSTKEPSRKVDARPQSATRQTAPTGPPAVETARRETAVSDAQWLDAVRGALVAPKTESQSSENPKPAAVTAAPAPGPATTATVPQHASDPAPAIISRTPSESPPAAPSTAQVAPPTAPTVTQPMMPSIAPTAAPPLPPAISIAPPPQQADANHPVPPESIPDMPPTADAEVAKADEHHGSRIGKWISGIPLLGSIVDNGRQ